MEPSTSSSSSHHKTTWPLTLAALGIVYGDIGTSPLYALRECMEHAPNMARAEAVVGILSLIFFSLTFVVSFKYISFILRADNEGEGGIFALLALTQERAGLRKLSWYSMLVLAGAALLCGDGVITPAISVLSAAEGLKTIAPDVDHWIVPISVAILAALFWVQHKGTASIATVFGPIMLAWFSYIGLLGLVQICKAPEILFAISPVKGVMFLIHHPGSAAGIVGGVVLAVTGAESLYADLGHFGRGAIQRGWYFCAMPGLLLSYFGQGAFLLSNPTDLSNPFFAVAPPGVFRWILLGLSIAATVIASQALISGVFSLARQAVELGFFPRLHVVHTSSSHEGQIYVPVLNWFLAISCIVVVISFRSSDALAAAYGLAVTGTMTITSVVFYRVMCQVWKWSAASSFALCFVFFLLDVTFFGCNLTKFAEGGWLPLAIGLGFFAIMHTWNTGRSEVGRQVMKSLVDIDLVVKDIEGDHLVRVPGNAVFMAANPQGTPVVLLHFIRACRCLHKNVILLTIITESVPRAHDKDRIVIEEVGGGIRRVIARYGYMETPDADALLGRLAHFGIKLNPMATTFYFNRESIVITNKRGLWRWQKELYRVLSINARAARDYFGVQASQVIDIGLPVEL